MESPTRIPQTLTPSGSGRSRCSTDSNSPEFEFWRLQDPSALPHPDLLSADELFSDGVLLPLSLLPQSNPPPDDPLVQDAPPALSSPEPPVSSLGLGEEDKPSVEEARIAADAGPPTASKRWRDIFKKADKKREEGKERSERKKETRAAQGGSGSAELNINIWPFSRSRSAGNGGSRPRPGPTRKVSSAPCSRSNSAGENKSRKWPSSPGRAGVHLGRSSPVWQVKRTSLGGPKTSDHPIPRVADQCASSSKDGGDGVARRTQAATAAGGRGGGRSGGGGTKTAARVLNLNVPMCIGYRQHLSCRGGDSSAIAGAAASGARTSVGGGGEAIAGGRSNNLFNLRGLFTKKVY